VITERRSRRPLAAALVALVTIIALEQMSIATVLPLVERDLGDLWLYGWIGSAFTLAQLVGMVTAGRWADRSPALHPLLFGYAFYVLGLIASAFAPSMPALIGGRVIQGFGSGMAPAVAYVCIGRGFPPEERPRMFAWLSTAWVVPSLGGPVLASLVGERLGWRWVFGGVVPVAIVLGALVARVVRRVPPPVDPSDEPSALGTAARLAVGVGAVMAAATLGNPWAALPLVMAGVAMAVPAFRKLTPEGTLRAAPGTAAACALKGLLTFAFFGADFYIALMIVDGRGRSTTFAAVALMVSSITWTAGSWIQQRWIRSVGPRSPVRAGFLLVAAGVGVMTLGTIDSIPPGIVFLGTAISGLGIGLAFSSLSVAVLASAEPGREGFASSALQLCDVLGVSIGAGLGGAIVASGDRLDVSVLVSVGVTWVVCALVAVGASTLVGRLPQRIA